MLNGTGRLKMRHLLILVTPTIGTAMVLAIWMWLRSKGVFVPASDAEITTNAYLPIQGAIYGFTAVIILNRVIEEDVLLHQSVEAGDIEGIKKELKKRIHPLLHILMTLMTFFLIKGIAALPYESLWSGVKDVGSITFVTLLYWRIAVVLDNPLRSPWIRDVIPLEMYEKLGITRGKRGKE